MYNDTIKVANKIITYDDLFEIFTRMNEKLIYYKKISDSEESKNHMLEYRNRNWNFKDNGSRLQFDVDFYDDTQIRFDNYNNFISVFNSRLEEIKNIYVHYCLYYSVKTGQNDENYYSQYINLWIYEHKMNIDVSLSSADKKLEDIYELIKNKILKAPEKYDEVIKKKVSITTTFGLAIGFIPALIISTLFIFIPTVRQIYASGYVVYPLTSLFLALFIGGTIGSSILDKYYINIVPDQKYAGYDSDKGKSIYKDDIDKYVTTSEILIGKNALNLEYRKRIKAYKDKYKKWIPYEVGIMVLISIIVLFLGGF